MTITTTLRVATAIGNSVATVFPFEFPIYDSEDLEVRLYNRADNTYAIIPPANYSAIGIGPDSVGGAVTYNPGGIPIPSTQMLVIYRTVAYTQDTDISNQDGFYPDIIERQLDEIVMQIQQVAEEVGRALVLPPTTDIDSENFIANTLYLSGMLLGGGTDFPSTRLDGSALQPGDLFTLAGQANPGDNGLYTFIDPGWSKANTEGTLETLGYVFATNGQTSVPISGGYTVNAIDVYRNGLRQIIGTPIGTGQTDFDCDASDGLTLVFPAATLLANDLIFWVKKKPLTINSLTAGDIANVPSGTVAATSVQGAINELDSEKVPTARQITTSGLLIGGGALTADRSFSVPAASDAETIAGLITDKATTPAGVKAAILAAGVTPAFSLLATGVTAGLQSTLDLALTAGYKHYVLYLDNFKPSTSGSPFTLFIATDGVPTFINTGTSYIYTGRRTNNAPTAVAWDGATSGFQLSASPLNGGSGMGAYQVDIFNSGVDYGSINALSNYRRSDAGQYKERVEFSGSYYGSAVAWTHIRIAPAAGTIANGGLYRLLGIA